MSALSEPPTMAFLCRADLQLSAGKLAVQCAHAAIGSLKQAKKTHSRMVQRWQETSSRKICLSVDDEEDSEEDEAPEGYYSFSIPSIVQLLDGGKKIDNRCINEDHEIDTDWLIDTDEKDFKNIIYGVYGFGKEVLFNDEFVIKNRYNG